MYCKNCGQKIEPGQKFCVHCGNRIVYAKAKSRWLLGLCIVFCLLCVGAAVGCIYFIWYPRTLSNKNTLTTEMNGRSMDDTLHDGDRLTIDKLSYAYEDPRRYDIIAFRPKGSPEELYIKRIIGLPGETVQIDDAGNIFIDGELLEENYGKETILNPGGAAWPITLGDDEYFVLGDNRNNSRDSRNLDHVGKVARDTIIGKVLF